LWIATSKKLQHLFPNCVTEAQGENGELKKPLILTCLNKNFHKFWLKVSKNVIVWIGWEKRIYLTANAPIAKTLRPCREESVNFDKTENLFIEGDNLEALKLLQENYLGKVKMIYIDPPYLNAPKTFM
jgi:adenine-specific DNA-methyltransferase